MFIVMITAIILIALSTFILFVNVVALRTLAWKERQWKDPNAMKLIFGDIPYFPLSFIFSKEKEEHWKRYEEVANMVRKYWPNARLSLYAGRYCWIRYEGVHSNVIRYVIDYPKDNMTPEEFEILLDMRML